MDFILDSADPIQSGMVSRRHARVEKRPLDGVFCLHDGSMNGVFINDIKIRSKPFYSYFTKVELQDL